MTITKLGHCCLVIEEHGIRILFDPGAWTTAQNDLKNIHAILITHEHQDHCHTESISAILKNNLGAVVYTNNAVGKILSAADIPFTLLEDGGQADVNGVSVAAHGTTHAVIHSSYPSVQNTGYCIAERFFYPGDALDIVPPSVDILALPVAGPWMKVSDAVDYAIRIQPKLCFPVHDGMLNEVGLKLHHMLPQRLLSAQGIDFRPLNAGESLDG